MDNLNRIYAVIVGIFFTLCAGIESFDLSVPDICRCVTVIIFGVIIALLLPASLDKENRLSRRIVFFSANLSTLIVFTIGYTLAFGIEDGVRAIFLLVVVILWYVSSEAQYFLRQAGYI